MNKLTTRGKRQQFKCEMEDLKDYHDVAEPCAPALWGVFFFFFFAQAYVSSLCNTDLQGSYGEFQGWPTFIDCPPLLIQYICSYSAQKMLSSLYGWETLPLSLTEEINCVWEHRCSEYLHIFMLKDITILLCRPLNTVKKVRLSLCLTN